MSEALERRAKWDRRFLDMAELVASWSKDPSTKCGAVIVRPDLTVCSVGYNGFPRRLLDVPEVLQAREEKYSRVVHAEMNAILHAPERVTDYTLYMFGGSIVPSCDRCAAHIIQAGIGRMVTYAPDEDSEGYKRWRDSIERAQEMYREAGVEWTPYLHE